jgi:Localisation of periplasmic protein complexes.
VRFRWLLLLSSFLSVFLFSAAAQARELLSWRFDTTQNRLEFTTDAGVQPKAQLISNPTRVVIDLPGISLRRSATQPGRGGIREIRVGQLDTKTTRIVIELAPRLHPRPPAGEIPGGDGESVVGRLTNTPTRHVATRGEIATASK